MRMASIGTALDGVKKERSTLLLPPLSVPSKKREKISTECPFVLYLPQPTVIPNRQFPSGVLQLIETIDNEKVLLEELPTSSRNRDRMNQMRNQLLMLNPKRTITVSENNAIKHNRP